MSILHQFQKALKGDGAGKALLEEFDNFCAHFQEAFPDIRLWRVFSDAVRGVLAARNPIITQMATAVREDAQGCAAGAKRLYRFFRNPRFTHRDLLKPACGLTAKWGRSFSGKYICVALDFVNLSKPYSRKLEGLSEVLISLKGGGETGPGYPAILALAIQGSRIGLAFAKLFSYVTEDFLSQNEEAFRAIRYTLTIFKGKTVRFLADRGFDDRKMFHFIAKRGAQFIIRVYQDRLIDVWNERQERWEREKLIPIAETLPLVVEIEALFRSRGRRQWAIAQLGYQKIRLPKIDLECWLVSAECPIFKEPWFLLTNVPVEDGKMAIQIFRDFRLRSGIEDFFRFLQEKGLDWEEFRLQTLERIRRLIAVVLAAAIFIFRLPHRLPTRLVQRLRTLGGKLGTLADKDGPYLLLRGVSRVFSALTVFRLAFGIPPP